MTHIEKRSTAKMKKRNHMTSFAERRKELSIQKKSRQKFKRNGNPTQEQLVQLLQFYRSANYEKAEALSLSLTQNFPTHPFAWKVLGGIFKQTGRLKLSLNANQKCVELSPLDAEAHNNLGVAQKELAQIDKAESNYKKAIKLNPTFAPAYNNLGLIYKRRNEFTKAESSFKQAISLDANYFDAYFNLSTVQKQMDKICEAEASCRIALSLHTSSAKILNNLGCILHTQGKLEEAFNYHNNAVSIDSCCSEYFHNLGITQKALKFFDAAEKSFNRAIELDFKVANTHVYLSDTFIELGKIHDAKASMEHALFLERELFLDQHFLMVHDNLISNLKAIKDFDSAVEYCETAVNSQSNFIDAKLQLAWLNLMLENFSDGFQQFETRHDITRTHRSTPLPKISKTKYLGRDLHQDLKGKRLLIIPEQGVGDEVMFASVFNELKSLMKKFPCTCITLVCDQRLVNLFSRSFDFLHVIPKNSKNDYSQLENDLDYWLFSGSLTTLYRKNIEDFNSSRSYLKPDEKLLETWLLRYSQLRHKKSIGLSWRGGYSEEMRLARSQSLQSLLPILSRASKCANIVNLQYGDHTDEITEFCRGTGITIHDWYDCDPLKDLDNFSAQIKGLDLVICIDNSTAHFAGALGVETYLMLPFDHDWRWGATKNSSYWYPDVMTLFRQNENSNWDNVVTNVASKIF
jgi:tetratricopeptide (TPR) repeat protein